MSRAVVYAIYAVWGGAAALMIWTCVRLQHVERELDAVRQAQSADEVRLAGELEQLRAATTQLGAVLRPGDGGLDEGVR